MNVDHADWRSFDKEDLKNLPSVRRQSIDKDLKYYFTGKPCKKGHITARYTMSATCVICHSEREKSRTKKSTKKLAKKEQKINPTTVMGIVINRPLSSHVWDC